MPLNSVLPAPMPSPSSLRPVTSASYKFYYSAISANCSYDGSCFALILKRKALTHYNICASNL